MLENIEVARGVKVAAHTTLFFSGSRIDVLADEAIIGDFEKNDHKSITEGLQARARNLIARYELFGLNVKSYKRIILAHKRPQGSASKSVDRELHQVPGKATEWACADDPDRQCCWCEYYQWAD